MVYVNAACPLLLSDAAAVFAGTDIGHLTSMHVSHHYYHINLTLIWLFVP